MRLERVAVRRGLGADAHALLLVAHLVPDVALGETARERLRGEHLGLAAPEVGVRDVLRGAERVALPAPASLLDAGDGDRQLRARADEDADVEDPVLLRADELLAVVEQHGAVGRVLDDELGHRARVRRLRDPEPARQRLVERDVGRDRVAAGEERCDDDPAVLHGLAELEGVECHGGSPFGFTRESGVGAAGLTSPADSAARKIRPCRTRLSSRCAMRGMPRTNDCWRTGRSISSSRAGSRRSAAGASRGCAAPSVRTSRRRCASGCGASSRQASTATGGCRFASSSTP